MESFLFFAGKRKLSEDESLIARKDFFLIVLKKLEIKAYIFICLKCDASDNLCFLAVWSWHQFRFVFSSVDSMYMTNVASNLIWYWNINETVFYQGWQLYVFINFRKQLINKKKKLLNETFLWMSFQSHLVFCAESVIYKIRYFYIYFRFVPLFSDKIFNFWTYIMFGIIVTVNPRCIYKKKPKKQK